MGAEYTHPPILKVSNTRYQVLFVFCSPSPLDSVCRNMLPLLGGLLSSFEDSGESNGDSSSIKSIDRLDLTVLTWRGGRLGLASVVSYLKFSFDTRYAGVESDSLRAIEGEQRAVQGINPDVCSPPYSKMRGYERCLFLAEQPSYMAAMNRSHLLVLSFESSD